MPEEIMIDPGCLTLPEDFADARDFKAEEAIKLDTTVKLPASFSLGKRIYKTSNQGGLGSCTAMGTTHGMQILKVRQNGVVPTTKNIITPAWKDLRAKMGHSTTQYDGGDYVERAINVALKEGIYIEESGEIARFDGYATADWNRDDESIETMKRYLYQGDPIVRCVRGDTTMWREMSAGQVKSIPANPTGGHCIALVGWDESGMWFINSRAANDANKLKSRFHIPYDVLKRLGGKLNYRYRVIYIKEDAKKDPNYIRRKNNALLILKALKKLYPEEPVDVKLGIETLSKAYRKAYPELNDELPINS